MSAEASGCSRPRRHGGIPGSRWRRRRHPERGEGGPRRRETILGRGNHAPRSAAPAQDRAAARRSLLASPRRQGGWSGFATLPLITMNGNQRSAAYCLPATQVPAAPVARAAGKPICEQGGDGQLAALGVSNGEGMCVARRAVGVAWLTWLLRVGEPGRVVAIGIWSHTVWDLHCVE